MPLYNQDGVVSDSWRRGDAQSAQGQAGESVLVSLAELHEHHDVLFRSGQNIGVELDTDAEPKDLVSFLDRLSLISINFHTFKDGRGFTLARLLRERFGYAGELRASGDILPDQLLFLARVGFSTFELPEKVPAERVFDALERYSVWFQAAADSQATVQTLRQSAARAAAE